MNFQEKKNKLNLLKIAIVHDYLAEYGGAERVIEAFGEIFPQSDFYFAFVNKKKLPISVEKTIFTHKVKTTFLQNLPFFKKLFSPLRFLAPLAFKKLNLDDYDLILSSSNAYFAKAASGKNAKHFCYCHTPARSLYGYVTQVDWKKNKLMLIYGSILNHFLRLKDYQVAQKVDYFIANSKCVAKRIKKFYRKDSKVIYPPVSLGRETMEKDVSKEKYFLYVNRLALAKHPDLAIEACLSLGCKIKVVGDGKIKKDLEKKYQSNLVEFLGFVNDDDLRKLYSQAEALLYPVEDEDFGIVPVEAMSFGIPVLAFYSGGPKETIINKKTGLFFYELNVESIVQSIKQLREIKFDSSEIRKWALTFNKKQFEKNLVNYLYEKISL
jgi:glycosyltransferase involved in cell wall biosynthesis